ncbi:DEAD/DEAH box helicase family protein [Shouchella miscanthi]|uniref:DEAD/DEAH box helicase family protein n=1 Tax=Shouchella miscanthi TaxID=2598861 RepID=A0ABU6NPZ4_9BACI|nr:DEAD/DEAH box helicase family protein [Shouchella miscanthi]
MTDITVVDSVMGSGKTQWAIQHMSEAGSLDNFIYITPFLSEVARIKETVKGRTFVEPTIFNDTSKLDDLKRLIAANRDIVSTHALFARADEEIIELLEQSGYTLILDEVMDVVESVSIKPADIKRLQSNGDIFIDEETKQANWTGDPEDNSRYRDIRELAQAGNLYLFRSSFMVWAFPPRVFSAFSKAIVLTYLFNCQLQRYYFDMFDFSYDYKGVEKVGDVYELCEHDIKREKREDLYALIKVYEGKLNDVGKGKWSLSQAKLKQYDDQTINQIKNNTSNFFRRYANNAKKADVYISTLKEIEQKLSPRGFKACFIPHNARATNEYADRRAVAYLINRFINRDKAAFFQENNISVNEELYALSELVQWLWRSRIRNGEPIDAYIPSERMRNLLNRWAKYEI